MKRSSTGCAVTVLCAAASCDAFLNPVGKQPLRLRPGCEQFQRSLRDEHYPPRGDVSVGLFRGLLKKLKKDDGGDGEKEGEENDIDSSSSSAEKAGDLIPEATGEKEEEEEEEEVDGATPFFANQYLDSLEDEEKAADTVEATPIDSKVREESAVAATTVDPTPPVEIVKETKEEESPLSQAQKLRAQAARIRLEADKRQVELTLEKIAKLNGKLEGLKKKETVDAKDQLSLEEELQRLKSQLITDEKGEIKPVAAPIAAVAKSESASNAADASNLPASSAGVQSRPSLSAEDLEERVKKFEEAPEFMKVLVAKTIGYGVDGDTPGAVDRLNATDIVQKLYDDGIDFESISVNPDFSSMSEEEKAREMIERAYKKSNDVDGKPVFSEEQIQAKVKELQEMPKLLRDVLSAPVRGLNDTEIATIILEEEWADKQRKKKGGFFGNMFGDKEKGEIGRDGERMDLDGDRGTFSRLFSDDSVKNGTVTSDTAFMMESLFPASTRKEDETPDQKEVNAFLNDVVTPTKAFTPSSDPVPVPGGWIIRGKNECKSGEELINKLDLKIANAGGLRDKISFFVIKDPFPDSEQILDPLNWPQVLFVAGPDVARDPALILRTAASSVGIATAWYGSIYPFLANSKLLDRANEAMELADAGMSSDMSWLSEMSIPLFLSFMALQATHEVAHQVVARSRNFEANVPTLVPSIMTGITNSITSLKTSPKNKQDLVDFAVAGPLAGMIGSILVLCYGLVLTATAESVESFPGLPLAILRQSSLGGGLIDLFLGNGVLNVPASAEGAQMLATTLIALHPLAVAGFASLIVNALALVPAGRLDGGRISMALFGRSGSQGVTFASLSALFIVGFAGDDLLLFFFTYIVFFQSELEIPLRNEVDDVGISSVVVASFAGFLMLLTLIPM
eukprot:CAMPEP_0181092712 /NCGR_PEP_ID=MMETSP1071-20121207/9061_1 /TAXON_ID=35127 /ORGANISM="Thalassiosira sp., Strain NH16" /LENGTH=909 /DNA_ID=CAMNT_0023174903 /DNA_START=18 /DNA_END=2747 /DNA_ORIENTATION=+